MESERKGKALLMLFLIWLVSDEVVTPVMCRRSLEKFADQKNCCSPDMGADPEKTPLFGTLPHSSTPTTSHGGSGFYHPTSDGSPSAPLVAAALSPPPLPVTPAPLTAGISTPPSAPGSSSWFSFPPIPFIPGISTQPSAPGTSPRFPFPLVPFIPGISPGSGSVFPFPPVPFIPGIPTPAFAPGSSPRFPFPLIPFIQGISPGSGSGFPFPPIPFIPGISSTGTSSDWRTHPEAVRALSGYWRTDGQTFELPTTPALGRNLSLQEALSNTRNDGIGALLREGTASLLNTMVNKMFPLTTQQVWDALAAALVSDEAAAAQAKLFKKANEDQLEND